MNLRHLSPTHVLALLLAACCASPAQAQVSTFFRFNDMDLRDPHVHLSVPIFGCRDATDIPVLGQWAFNDELQTAIQTDADSNGLLDLSLLIELMPMDQSLASNPMQFGSADCSAPLASTICFSRMRVLGLEGAASLSTAGTCLSPVVGTARPYTPAIVETTAPCFVSSAGTVVLDVGGLPVPLEDAQVAATFVGNPANHTINGLLRGFISETVADATLIPDDIPLVGGQPLSLVLPGGTGNCAVHSDKDVRNGVSGWWFYFNFQAPRVTGTGSLPMLNDGFE
jgi:hypothetical protein